MVQVTVDGGKDFVAKVLGQDEDKDVAVLQVEEKAACPSSAALPLSTLFSHACRACHRS